MFKEMYESMSHALFGIVIAWLAVVILTVACGLYFAQKKPNRYRLFGIVALCVHIALFIAFIVVGSTGSYKTYVHPGQFWYSFGLYICTIAIIAVIVAIALLFGKKIECNHTKSIAYAALCLAMSFSLSYIRLFQLPQGGSVTLVSLLPLMLYSYMFGIRKGVMIGFIYGLLQFIQEPWFVHPMQFLLDYPIAFSAVGLAGLLKEVNVLNKYKPVQFALSGIIVVILRYASHVISGIFVWGSSNPSYGVVAWAFLYNSFAFVDMALTLVVGCILFASKNFAKVLDSARK